MLERSDEYDKMAAVERDLWWYRSLQQLTVETIQSIFSERRDIAVLDAGCGSGGMLLTLRELGYPRLQGFDLSPVAVDLCRARGLNVHRDDLRNLGLSLANQRYDVIISNDTLYFLSKDERRVFFRDCHDHLRPGGLIICNLPALAAFRGTHDVAVGIEKRFSREDVQEMFESRQFEPVRLTYWPFLLSPLVFLTRFAQRLRLRAGRVKEIRSDVELPSPWLNRLLLSISSFENNLMKTKPFASSLLLALRCLPSDATGEGTGSASSSN